MMQFSWMLRQIIENKNFTEEAAKQRQEYEARNSKVINLIPKIMSISPRISWTCDPKEQVKGVTYDEVTRLLQGYIENEVNLNTENTCKQSCDFYEVANVTCTNDKEKEVLFCQRQKLCKGTILDCQFVEADMGVCLSVSMIYSFMQSKFDYGSNIDFLNIF